MTFSVIVKADTPKLREQLQKQRWIRSIDKGIKKIELGKYSFCPFCNEPTVFEDDIDEQYICFYCLNAWPIRDKSGKRYTIA